MAKATKKKTSVGKKILKKEEEAPRQILASEARVLEMYPIGKESARYQLKLLDAQIEVATLTAELEIKKLKEEKSVIYAHMNAEKTKFNDLGIRLKEKYGVEQLSFDPETLEIGE